MKQVALCFLLGLMILVVVPQLPIPRDSGILTLVRGPGIHKLNSLGLAFLFATPCCQSAEKRGAALLPLGAGLYNLPLEVGRVGWGEGAEESQGCCSSCNLPGFL